MRLDIPHGLKVNFEDNIIKSLAMVQPLFNDLHYDASILLLESTTPQCTITVNNNVLDNI